MNLNGSWTTTLGVIYKDINYNHLWTTSIDINPSSCRIGVVFGERHVDFWSSFAEVSAYIVCRNTDKCSYKSW